MTLSLLDWGVLLAYLAVVLLIGVYFARRNTSTEEYFVGGHLDQLNHLSGLPRRRVQDRLAALSAQPGVAGGVVRGRLCIPAVFPARQHDQRL